jgi:hypothetical protein
MESVNLAQLPESEIPYHNVINSQFDSDSTFVTATCRGSKFNIEVHTKHLRGTLFQEEYAHLVEKIDEVGQLEDDDDYEAICDWVLAPCFPHFQEVPPPESKDITLQAYHYPPTRQLRLVVVNGSLQAKAVRYLKSPHEKARMIPSRDLPPFPKIMRIKASEVQIVPSHKNQDPMCDIPERVRTADGTLKFFKPAIQQSQLIRELETATRIAEQGLSGKIRISNLHGVAVSQDLKNIIGLLFDLIPSISRNLQDPILRDDQEKHAKWEKQVEDIIKTLHAHDIVWGDVHPGNVIDENFDAWVIDFGGGYVESFVHPRMGIGLGFGRSFKSGLREQSWKKMVVWKRMSLWVSMNEP